MKTIISLVCLLLAYGNLRVCADYQETNPKRLYWAFYSKFNEQNEIIFQLPRKSKWLTRDEFVNHLSNLKKVSIGYEGGILFIFDTEKVYHACQRYKIFDCFPTKTGFYYIVAGTNVFDVTYSDTAFPSFTNNSKLSREAYRLFIQSAQSLKELNPDFKDPIISEQVIPIYKK